MLADSLTEGTRTQRLDEADGLSGCSVARSSEGLFISVTCNVIDLGVGLEEVWFLSGYFYLFNLFVVEHFKPN